MKKPFFSYMALFVLISFMMPACNNDKSISVNCYPGITYMDTAVLLVLGQSNAGNFGETRYASSCENIKNFYNGNFYPLADPLKGATGDGGSVWSRLGDILVQNRFARIVIIAPVAIGETTIQQWKPGGELNHLITESIAQLHAKRLRITHVLWHQGESNNSILYPTITPEENAQQYRSSFLELVEQLRSLGVNAPIFPAVTTRCAGLTPDIALEKTQRELAIDSLGIYNGPNTDLLGNEFRHDKCHLNDLGLKIHAFLWADILIAHK